MNEENFAKLENLNAQMDIWVDDEDYDKVEAACEIEVSYRQHLRDAFKHPTCTAAFDTGIAWFKLLSRSFKAPVSAVWVGGDHLDEIEDWSFFFWAKLIRAKIQAKGTDCYYRKLDEVVAYIESFLPVIREAEPQTAKFATICLLEMSSAGVGADPRSFAERAQRILREQLKGGQDESLEAFRDFYDLWARYNIGVGYFHDGQHRKAAMEFNEIIFKFKTQRNGALTRIPHGRDLLFLPAVLYRAEIQLKLQLAYHAIQTLDKYFGQIEGYKAAKSARIRAEAYEQMGRQKESWKELQQVYQFVFGENGLGTLGDVKTFRIKPGDQKTNIKGQLQSLLISEHLDYLDGKKIEEAGTSLLRRLNSFFADYKSSIDLQKPKRSGYFEQVARYLSVLSENYGIDGATASLKEIYRNNESGLFEDEKDSENKRCPCKEKGIDLRRLENSHYEAFYKSMIGFFRAISTASINDPRFIEKVQKKETVFRDRLIKLEETHYDLSWRKRELRDDTELRSHWCNNGDRCIKDERASSYEGLIKCRTKNNSGQNDPQSTQLVSHDYEVIMDNWDKHFLEHLQYRSIHDPICPGVYFVGLQRWNSTSPAQGQSLGGGYLLYHTNRHGCVDMGVAIDPGFDFIRNLFHEGFSLSDIDVVLLSHAHLDHIRDFESMITLLLELGKRTKSKVKRKLHAIMTLGVYKRLEHVIRSPGLREFIDPYILDIEKEIDPEFLSSTNFTFINDAEHKSGRGSEATPKFTVVNGPYNSRAHENIELQITPTRAYHNDYSEYSDSFGFVIRVRDHCQDNAELDYTFGYTGDTSWHSDIMGQYKSCQAILIHLGSLIDREKEDAKEFSYYSDGDRCYSLAKKKNHPYLFGLLHLLTEVGDWPEKNKPLILISEFGEEMRGKIRLDLVNRLSAAYDADGLSVLPVDVGMNVILAVPPCPTRLQNTARTWQEFGQKEVPLIWCSQGHFVSLKHAAFETYGHDEALFCLCRTCGKSSPKNVLRDRLQHLYEVGRELRPSQS